MHFQEIAQRAKPLGRWAFMHTKQAMALCALENIGRTGVGSQHALFDQAVGIVTHTGKNFLNAAIRIKLHVGFDRIKINGPSGFARREQHTKHCFQAAQHFA